MTAFEGCGTALVTPFTERGDVDFRARRAGRVADRRRHRLPRAVRVHRRGPDPGRRGARTRRGRRRRDRGRPRAGRGRRDQQRYPPRGRGDPAHVRARRRRHPLGHALLQQAHAGRPGPPLPGRGRRLDPAGLPLQRPRPHRRQSAPGHRASAGRASEREGIKEASGDLRQIMELLRRRPAGFAVLSGDDWLAFPVAAAGGEG